MVSKQQWILLEKAIEQEQRRIKCVCVVSSQALAATLVAQSFGHLIVFTRN